MEDTLRVTSPGGSAVPEGTRSGPWRRRSPASRLRRLAGLLAAQHPFAIPVMLAAALRAVVMLGYPPAMFFNDSYNYMTDAVRQEPDAVRANGYPFLLRLLLPAHNLDLVTGLQGGMGLAAGIAIYAVLRRRGLPWWGATIPALPSLFDVWELQIEHTIGSDALFTALVTAVVILLCWWDRPPLWAVILAGLLAGYSATVRSVGELLLVVVAIGMIARRAGWQRVLAVTLAGTLPVACYMTWFYARDGRFALTESSGTFLYSRVSSFAECSRMDPPPALRVLCDPRPPGRREGSQEYLWANDTPLATLTGPDNSYRFTPHIEYLTSRFAERAIVSQPLSYAAVVADDTWRTFGWTRFRSDLAGSGDKFRFEAATEPVPGWVTGDAGNAKAAAAFGGSTLGRPRATQPWAAFLQFYEKWGYLRGPFLLAFLVTGLGGIVISWRRRHGLAGQRAAVGGLGLLPWLVGVALIVGPPMTAGFSYRYVLTAVPATCLAAGLAFAGRGSLIAWSGSGAGGSPTPARHGSSRPAATDRRKTRSPGATATPRSRRRRTACATLTPQ